ncbi:MAG: hypothetical protein IJB57_06085 [Clostridia bacterium]|nr:hypothetical protein [Clostridia bacterium]
MKRSIIILLCAVMIVLALMPIASEEVQGSVLSVELLKYYRYETEQIIAMVNEQYIAWRDYLGDDPDAIPYELMYQVYYLDMKDVVSAYDSDGTFVKNISDRYYWVVPNYEKGTEVQVVRNNDAEYGWAIRRGTHYMDSIRSNYEDTVFGIAEIYDNILTQCPGVNKLSFKMVYDELNDIHLMYFTSEGEEYVVPYFASENFTWLTNAMVYPVKDYIELMRTNTVDDTSNIDLDEGKMGTETIYLNYIVIGTVAVIGVAIVAVLIAHNKKNKAAEAETEDT